MARNEKPSPGGSFIPLLTVLGTVGVMVVGLVVLAGRAGVLMMLAVAAVLVIPVLHYITWGRWLSKSLRRERDEEASRGENDE